MSRCCVLPKLSIVKCIIVPQHLLLQEICRVGIISVDGDGVRKGGAGNERG